MSAATIHIYKSSAGSGKTYTLVKEYLRILLQNPEAYRQILAITFTNKAAEEMKTRIIKGLATLSRGEETELAAILSRELSLSSAEIQVNSGKALENILHDYSSFSVSTIDSFTHHLIQHFARELGLPANFEVELDNRVLLDKAVSEVLRASHESISLSSLLQAYLHTRLQSNRNWNIEHEIKHVGKELFSEEGKIQVASLSDISMEELLNHIRQLASKCERFEKELAALSKNAFDMIEKAGLSLSDFSWGKSGAIGALLKLQYPQTPEGYTRLITTGRFANALSDDKWAKKSSKVAVELLLDNGLREQLYAVVTYYENHIHAFTTAYYAHQYSFAVAVIKSLGFWLETYKKRNKLLHISDFQEKIATFIRSESADYLFWRLGERYKHYFIDEFQDTSLQQWTNLYPLLEHIKSGGHSNGTILLVGDAKQAIYRWRGGQVELLELVAPELLEAPHKKLQMNYRSGEAIVNFNNQVFDTALKLLNKENFIRLIYTGFKQQTINKNLGKGYVKAEWVDRDQFYDEKIIEKVVSQINALQLEGFFYRDIALLTRTRDEGAKLVQALDQASIPVLSAEALLLYKEPVIRFIINIFTILSSPDNKVAMGEAMHFYFYHLAALPVKQADVKIAEISLSGHPYTTFINKMPGAFGKLKFQLDKLSVYELAEQLISLFGLQAIAPAYLQRLLDIILDFQERFPPDLSYFLTYWDERKATFSITQPTGQNAVQVLTIHKSKGLQFPVVLLPYLNWYILPRSDHFFWATDESGRPYLLSPKDGLKQSDFQEAYQAEVEKTMLDNLNLLYVAFTRPEQRLYLWLERPLKEKDGEFSKIGELLAKILEDEAFLSAIPEYYEAGFPEFPSEQAHPAIRAIVQKYLPTSDWRKKLRLRKKYKQLWGNEEQKHKPKKPVLAEVLKRLDRKDSIFKVLSQLEEEGVISVEALPSLEEQLNALLIKPFWNALYEFADKIYKDEISIEEEIIHVKVFEKDTHAKILCFDGLVDESKRLIINIYKSKGFSEVEVLKVDWNR